MNSSAHMTIYSRSSIELEIRGSINSIDFLYPMGLRWSCTRCGRCCKDPEDRERTILLLPSDIERFDLQIDKKDFIKSITGEEPFIAEMLKKNGSCVFLTKQGCSFYDKRSLLCRLYPFWINRKGNLLIVRVDDSCSGLGRGEPLTEKFYKQLVGMSVRLKEGL